MNSSNSIGRTIRWFLLLLVCTMVGCSNMEPTGKKLLIPEGPSTTWPPPGSDMEYR